jgi:RNA recognition motif-containing protein
MAPPGIGVPPGAAQANTSLPPRPGGLPPNFQPPPNMAHINFSAPVIRLGTTGPSKDMATGGNRGTNAEPMSARRGLGMDSGMDRSRPQRDGVALVPPTREEVMRTIFIGKIPESLSDDDLENILRAAGSLRRWTRAYDADSKPCTFGFAEYEDAESLETATEVLQDIEVPAKRPEPNSDQNGLRTDIEKVRLLIQVDDASRRYAEEWREKRGDDESAVQFRIDTAKELLASVLTDIYNPSFSAMDVDRDAIMHDGENKADPVTGEIITIPLTGDDELSDIPPEMRETVAAEITAFRDRSNRRDMERLKREEELEAAEKRANRANQSAPAAAPSGPSGNTNGIPVGPKGAPSGPKGFSSGGQNGVSFVNGASLPVYITKEEENSDASDEELEGRRHQKKADEQEKLYLDYERRWLNRERSRASALERERAREDDESSNVNKDKETAAKRLKDFNDDTEQSRRAEEYYRDRSQWLRNRSIFRSREKEMDDRDRAMEEREKAREVEKREHARGLADSFLEKQAEDLGALQVREPQRLKISLGAAAQRVQAAAPRRTIAEVEGLLEDEEEVVTTAKRTLVPIKFDSAAEAAGLTEEERHLAVRQLAADIPTDKEGLWAWNIQWDFVDDSVLADQIRPFVEKKMVEYLGVQEEMLVHVVEEHIKKRGSPEDLLKELEGVSPPNHLASIY